uniref:Uncharacterized protein n=1 Tax=Kalanchoe fedtschenkoi TaxID=63787 RepID=A0A7N0URR6_KALFE
MGGPKIQSLVSVPFLTYFHSVTNGITVMLKYCGGGEFWKGSRHGFVYCLLTESFSAMVLKGLYLIDF